MSSEILKVKYWIGNKSAEQISGQLRLSPFEKNKAAIAKMAQQPKKPALLPEEQKIRVDSPYICAYAVPIELEIRDFCEFVKCCEPFIEEMRVATGSQQNSYLILIMAKSAEGARTLVNTLHGLKFTEFFEGRCDLATILSASTFTGRSAPVLATEEDKEAMADPHILFSKANTTQLSCPICLEKLAPSPASPMVKALSSVSTESPATEGGYKLSILCGHYYHSICLANCKDELCPLCRSPQSPGECNKCEECGSVENLWLCLICGFVGCWNMQNPCLSHSRNHYEQSMHTYAMNILNKNVWDYAKEGYVHRLIQNKVDGKLVEFEDQELIRQQQVLGQDIFQVSLKKYQHQKLDALNYEYNLLLVSQLDTQRKYFEARLRDYEKEAKKLKDQTEDTIKAKTAQLQQVVEETKEEEARNKKLKQESVELHSHFEQMLKEEAETKKAIQELTAKVQVVEKARSANNSANGAKLEELDKKIEGLRNEVKDLKFHISAQSKVKTMSQGAGGQTLIFQARSGKGPHKKKK